MYFWVCQLSLLYEQIQETEPFSLEMRLSHSLDSKYRFRILNGLVKELVDHDIKMLCEWKSCEVIELNIQPDHIHLVIPIPPKVSVSLLMGTLKGELAIKLFKNYPQLKKKPYWGNHFWSRGYFVNTVGINEDVIRRYVKYQEEEDKKEENNGQHFNLFD
jgi:putative transposase